MKKKAKKVKKSQKRWTPTTLRLEYASGNVAVVTTIWELPNDFPEELYEHLAKLAKALDKHAVSKMSGVLSNEGLPYRFQLEPKK